jgi:uncharacterized protein YggL (DUF469 family)
MGVELNLIYKNKSDLEIIMDNFHAYIGKLNLCIGNDNSSSFTGFISSQERYGLVTEAYILSVTHWLKEQSIVSEFNIRKLVDANYGM